MEKNKLIIYKNSDGNIIVDAIYKDETLWLSQKGMSKVFNVGVPAISKHLKNIFAENELDKNSVVSKMEITAPDEKNYNTEVYSLDAIIAVGYRINSKKATEFRIWATKVLKEYMIKGFVLNDERFINGNKYDAKYFDELLERIKTIRVSERMAYQKITDLFIATCGQRQPLRHVPAGQGVSQRRAHPKGYRKSGGEVCQVGRERKSLRPVYAGQAIPCW